MHFRIRIAIRVFYIAIHAIEIILIMFGMLKTKRSDIEMLKIIVCGML